MVAPVRDLFSWTLLAWRAGSDRGRLTSFRELANSGSSELVLRLGGYSAREWSGLPRSEWQRRTSGVHRDQFWVWFLDPSDEADRAELEEVFGWVEAV